MVTEHQAIERARPGLAKYFVGVTLTGAVAFIAVLVAESDDYYRRGPSGWGLLVMAWVLGMYGYVVIWQYLDQDYFAPGFKRVRLEALPDVPVLARRNPSVRMRLAERHAAVKEAYGGYLSDISQILEMPLLADESVEDTHAFVAYLVTCEDAARGSDLEYERAVDGLEIRWKAAVNYAKRKKWSTLPEQDQKVIRRAKALLDRATDLTATVAERQASLRKALELLESVVCVPTQAITAITDRVQRTELGGSDANMSI